VKAPVVVFQVGPIFNGCTKLGMSNCNTFFSARVAFISSRNDPHQLKQQQLLQRLLRLQHYGQFRVTVYYYNTCFDREQEMHRETSEVTIRTIDISKWWTTPHGIHIDVPDQKGISKPKSLSLIPQPFLKRNKNILQQYRDPGCK
jgi:hypothetical protein